MVYRCSENALNALDRKEGVPGGHYKRLLVNLVLDDGKTVDAIAYIACEEYLCDEKSPSEEYLGYILRGAKEHELPTQYIENLIVKVNSLKD